VTGRLPPRPSVAVPPSGTISGILRHAALGLKPDARTAEITIGGTHCGGGMGEVRENDINLEKVADKLAAAEDASLCQDEAAAGMTDAQGSPDAKKEKTAGKRATKKKAARKKAKKTRKKTAKKKTKKKKTTKTKKKARKRDRAKAVPKKRTPAEEPMPEEAPPEAEPDLVQAIDEASAPEVAVAAGLGEAPEDAAEKRPCEGREESPPREPSASSPRESVECVPEGPAASPSGEPVELSPQEALRLLGCLGDASEGASAGNPSSDAAEAAAGSETAAGEAESPGRVPASGDGRGVLSSIIDASCRVLTFESEGVEDGMCVARAAVEQLRLLVDKCGLGVSIGPICRTPEEFVAEWDNTPVSMPMTIIANLSCAGAFLPGVVDERPRVASAYWIVFETLRGEVSTARSEFLSELRSRHRLRAIGFGPRNVLDAARAGAEALRGHVEWGFGRGPVSIAG